MATPLAEQIDEQLIYPETDGKPMAENTLQYQCIVAIQGGIDAQFRDDPNVFVAGDLFWYAVKGQPNVCLAPDVLVVLGRPKGHRRSYMQWREAGIAPQVIFEILSPGNTIEEMEGKFAFYQRYGVEEYYIYDPDNVHLAGYLRVDERLQAIEQMNGWSSPRLKIRFDMAGPELVVFGRDGQPFLTFVEMAAAKEIAQKRADKEQRRADKERQRADKEQRRADKERQRADSQQKAVDQERQRAEQERHLREKAQTEANRLAARLRDLGVNPDS